ncbi:MAG: hypothetical protein M1358_15575 [Chloroflexi bacterium]|nr:hypothetical protein [Chloroflexota bacterium]
MWRKLGAAGPGVGEGFGVGEAELGLAAGGVVAFVEVAVGTAGDCFAGAAPCGPGGGSCDAAGSIAAGATALLLPANVSRKGIMERTSITPTIPM